jgi:hypothetical protein
MKLRSNIKKRAPVDYDLGDDEHAATRGKIFEVRKEEAMRLRHRTSQESNQRVNGEESLEQLSDFANRFRANGVPYPEAKADLLKKAEELGLKPDDAKEALKDAWETDGQAEALTEEFADARIETIRASDITPRRVTWLWDQRIPRGKYTLIGGDPGAAKTMFAIEVTAHLTTGSPWPDGAKCPQGHVVWFTAEDDPADTLVPRLIAAGADLRYVHFLKTAVRRDPNTAEMRPGAFTLADVDALKQRVRALGDVVAVVFDPVSAFVGKTDSHRNTEVRGLLAPLIALAASREFAVIGIDHLNKDQALDVLYRVGGSIAWIAAPRAAWLIAQDVNDDSGERRLFLRLKCNLAVDPGGLAFCIEEKPLRELKGASAPYIEWDKGEVHTNATEVLTTRPDKGPTKRDAAATWLSGVLASGPMSAGDAEKLAKAAGFTKDAVYRARQLLRVRSKRADKGKGWILSLPRIRLGTKSQTSNLKASYRT